MVYRAPVYMAAGLALLMSIFGDSGCTPGEMRTAPRPPAPRRLIMERGIHQYFDTNGNGIIDLFSEGDDARFVNRAEEVTDSRFGYGWDVETRARGVDFWGSRSQVYAKDAPDDYWVGRPWDQAMLDDLKTGEKAPLTAEFRRRISEAYHRNWPQHSKAAGNFWLIERRGGSKRFYFNVVIKPDGKEIDIQKTVSNGPDFTEAVAEQSK